MNNADPAPEIPKQVHLHDNGVWCEDSDQRPGWFFWDEAYACHGPWGTREEAARNFRSYCFVELGYRE